MFPIVGPPSFIQAVNDVLQRLRVYAPAQYVDAITYAPKAVFDPVRLSLEEPDGVLGRADGVFAIDGSDSEMFCWVFLHELGHMVALHRRQDRSERTANSYADETMAKLRRAEIDLDNS